jgi:RNA polymerase sigma factor (sigma-70 family)
MKASASGRVAVWTAAVSATAIAPHMAPIALGIAIIKELFDLLRARTDRISVLSYMRAAGTETYLNINSSGEATAIILHTESSVPGLPPGEEGVHPVPNNDEIRRVTCDLDPGVFCAEHHEDLLSYAMSHSRNKYDAEDAVSHVQEMIYTCHKRHGRLCPEGYDPVAWSKTVIINYVRTLWRREKTHRKRSAVMIPATADFTDDILDGIIAKEGLDFINTLSPRAHQIAMMQWGEGLPPKEIARLLGIKSVTVRASLYKTRQKMRARLGVVGEPPRKYTKETT